MNDIKKRYFIPMKIEDRGRVNKFNLYFSSDKYEEVIKLAECVCPNGAKFLKEE